MTNARTVLMSLDHLVAEMTAFPFVSVISLANPIERLDVRLSSKTASLWRGAERYFVAHFPHIGIDELISVRNRRWFGGDDDVTSLHRYLRRSSRNCLRQSGAIAEPKLPEGAGNAENDDAAARRAWRWLTFAMPGDLLLAGLAQDGHGPVRCNLLTPFVARMLREHGYAETHLHMGAGLDFPTAWASAVNVVARPRDLEAGMTYDAFRSPGADHDEGESLANWLVRAAIVRYLLAAFLGWGRPSGSLIKFLGDKTLWSEAGLSNSQIDLLRTAVWDLAHGKLTLAELPQRSAGLESSFTEMQTSYNALTKASLIPLPDKLDDVQRLDPLSAFFEARSHSEPTVQIQFLWKGFAYLDDAPHDKEFANLFWQVERVRCQVYRHCIQRPLTPGLMNFIRTYERKGAIIGALEQVELESCGVLGGVGKGLKSLEVRARPAGRKNDQLGAFTKWSNKLKSLRRKPEWQGVECAFALHFLKFRGSRIDRGLPYADDIESNADPELDANTMQFRWQDFRQKAEQRAEALADAIEQDPSWLRLLRAIDVCRDEHGVPTWVVAPLFKRVRQRVERAMAAEYADTGIELPVLRTTVHVGEDFVHLATGLRYMDEAMDYIPLQVGDRVGHGLALGIDPIKWAKSEHRQLLPREDRWFDLIWERSWHGRQGSDFGSARKTFVDDEIVRLSGEIFGDETEFDWTPARAMRFRKMLYDGTVENLGFPGRMLQTPPLLGLDRQLERYMTSPSVYRRCRKVIWVEVSHDGEAVKELQRLVRNRYAENGITIEVNPISNLLVGDLTDLTSHPLWRLAPGLENEYGATLRMCVGSDDPLPFATTLPEEYQFLYDSLLLAGQSHATAGNWLDMIRELGMESRFTEPV